MSKRPALPETVEIFLFSKKSGYDAIKLNLDALLLSRFPTANPDAINPTPFKGKQVSRETYQIKVKVAPEDVATMYEIGRVLLEKETL